MSPLITPDTQYSLRKRLVLALGSLLILFLGLVGFALDRAFKASIQAAVEERLQLQIYALLGVAEPDADGFFVPDLEEARFAQIDSGLYGFIFSENGSELWRSPSALNLNLQQSQFSYRELEPGQTFFGQIATDQQGLMAYAGYGTYWANQDQEFTFFVMESVAPTAAEIREFQSRLWFWLGGLALLLSVIQYFLLRWGLSPLQQLARDVSAIEAGVSDSLSNNYPTELQAVSDNLNLLIRSEWERQGRYRTTLGDLAHSLKTPLAVISGIVQQSGDKDGSAQAEFREIADQVERMNQIVTYQLKRAVKANNAAILARPVRVKPVLEKLLSALHKVYMDKQVKVTKSIQADACFHGEESDLTELLGNLLDNAFKY
ncbi:MAG: histidine kinase dimerization/phospho-acceptor domain-containing protein, partial [Pseudohongiellaceae bacterium]